MKFWTPLTQTNYIWSNSMPNLHNSNNSNSILISRWGSDIRIEPKRLQSALQSIAPPSRSDINISDKSVTIQLKNCLTHFSYQERNITSNLQNILDGLLHYL